MLQRASTRNRLGIGCLIPLLLSATMLTAQSDQRIAGQLSFRGFGDARNDISGSLALMGVAVGEQNISGQVSFHGIGHEPANISGYFAYEGLGGELGEYNGEILFSGVSITSDGFVGNLEFVGLTHEDTETAGELHFQGCAENLSDPVIARLPPATVQAQYDRESENLIFDQDLEGNWKIIWGDARYNIGYATLTKGGEWKCVGDNGCWYRFARDRGADWNARITVPELVDRNSADVEIEDDQMIINYGYGVLGQWRSSSHYFVYDNGNLMKGEWRYGDKTGPSEWHRLEPRARTVSNFTDIVTIGTDIVFETEYKDARFNSRGNRESFGIYLVGENLWGRQRWWLPNRTGLEIRSVSLLCEGWENTGQWYQSVVSCAGNQNVAGVYLDVVVWENARSGEHYLYFNDQVIPFSLSVLNAPATHSNCFN